MTSTDKQTNSSGSIFLSLILLFLVLCFGLENHCCLMVLYLLFQAAITKQKIKEENMQIKVIERAQQINVQTQEILRKEKELDATIRKPAEAEKYREEKIAEANKNKIILEAEAESESIRVHILCYRLFKRIILVGLIMLKQSRNFEIYQVLLT